MNPPAEATTARVQEPGPGGRMFLLAADSGEPADQAHALGWERSRRGGRCTCGSNVSRNVFVMVCAASGSPLTYLGPFVR